MMENISLMALSWIIKKDNKGEDNTKWDFLFFFFARNLFEPPKQTDGDAFPTIY